MRRALVSLLTILIVGLVPSSAQDQSLSVSPGKVRQGDAVFIRLVAGADAEPEVRWRNESYPLYRQGEAWIGAVPVSPDTPTGTLPLVVRYDRDGDRQEQRRAVQVTPVKFPVQYLRMAKNTARLYNFPGAKKEDAAITAAIRTKSDRRLWSGDWIMATKGRISTQYGVRRLRNGRPVGRHRGLDIAAPTGTPIVAPANGLVVLAVPPKQFKKYGGSVVLDHGMGITSMYIHMSGVNVKKGQSVTRGQQIGKVGEEGVATGPHLHWSVYVQATSLEPRFFVGLSKRGVNW